MAWQIRLDDVGKSVPSQAGERILFDGVKLNVDATTRLSVLGRSGSGKSTLLSIIAGLTDPARGEVVRTERPRIGFVFQNDTYLPWRSVSGNLEFAAAKSKSNKGFVSEARRVLAGLHLDPDVFLRRSPQRLSGGERRRFCLAMALMSDPNVLILDEANSALDEGSRFDVCDFLLGEANRRQLALVVVTHDLEEAIVLGDTLLVLDGRGSFSVRANTMPAVRNSRDRFGPVAQGLRAELAAEIFSDAA